MNVVLLIAVLVLVVGENAAKNTSPCMANDDPDAYREFVRRHVLQEEFDTNSHAKWRSYLTNYNLCDRPTQSFVDVGAENLYVNICNGSGKRQRINLCTSTSKVQLHDLGVNTKDCSVTSLSSSYRYVTVACDKVNNRCRPVHFESSQDNGPDNANETCKP